MKLITQKIVIPISAFLVSGEASATIMFDLNCYSSGGGTCTTASNPDSWGKITIEDSLADSNQVNIAVDLVGDHLLGMKDLYLNFDPSVTVTSFDVVSATSWDGSAESTEGITVAYSDTPYLLNPFNFNMTLCFSDSNNSPAKCNGDIGGLDPYTIMLAAVNGTTALNLDASMFNFGSTDTGQTVYALAHLQDCTSEQTGCDGGSIKVGATASPKLGVTSVPEPSVLALLGVGLLGLIGISKRKKTA